MKVDLGFEKLKGNSSVLGKWVLDSGGCVLGFSGEEGSGFVVKLLSVKQKSVCFSHHLGLGLFFSSDGDGCC